MKFNKSRGLARVRKVLAEAIEPMTLRELAKAACVSRHIMSNYYRAILVDGREMHIAGWDRHQFGWAPAYLRGYGKTPPKPKAPPPKVATAAWKARTGYVDPRYAHRRLAAPRDPILAALMGVKPGYQKRRTAHNQEKQA